MWLSLHCKGNHSNEFSKCKMVTGNEPQRCPKRSQILHYRRVIIMEACGCSRRFPPGGDKGGTLVLSSKERPGLGRTLFQRLGNLNIRKGRKYLFLKGATERTNFLVLAMSSLRGLGTITGAMCLGNMLSVIAGKTAFAERCISLWNSLPREIV